MGTSSNKTKISSTEETMMNFDQESSDKDREIKTSHKKHLFGLTLLNVDSWQLDRYFRR